ncbi:MAG: hypothetical protein K0R28_2798 [Paenibacillus sp.]|nr:hypothetical protein [Paenibacillus sp.]
MVDGGEGGENDPDLAVQLVVGAPDVSDELLQVRQRIRLCRIVHGMSLLADVLLESDENRSS